MNDRRPAMVAVAPVSRRALAALLDGGLLVAAVALADRARGKRLRDHVGLGWLNPLVRMAYYTSTTALAGRTLGQSVVGVRVIDFDSGRRPSWKASILRALIGIGIPELEPRLVASFLPIDQQLMSEQAAQMKEVRARYLGDPAASLVTCAAIFLGVWRRPDRRGLHDRIAGVIVVSATDPVVVDEVVAV